MRRLLEGMIGSRHQCPDCRDIVTLARIFQRACELARLQGEHLPAEFSGVNANDRRGDSHPAAHQICVDLRDRRRQGRRGRGSCPQFVKIFE
jgi:hypothetical protein